MTIYSCTRTVRARLPFYLEKIPAFTYNGAMFAELVINIEAPLQGTFHYHVPRDLAGKLALGHMVEVEFGRRLAQGIIIGFDSQAPVEDTKPIIGLVDDKPVLRPWQLDLARSLSDAYLTSLNSCLRLMLPPGLTRWADVILDINPYWDGSGRLTDNQRQLLELLREKGDQRGRQIKRALPKSVDWQSAANQLVRRDILRKASLLDPPRVKPKKVRTVELTAPPWRLVEAAAALGRQNKQAGLLLYLLQSQDPLPPAGQVLAETSCSEKQLEALEGQGLISRFPAETVVVPLGAADRAPADYAPLLAQLPAPASSLPAGFPLAELRQLNLVAAVEQPAAVGLLQTEEASLAAIYRLRGASTYYNVLTFLMAEAVPVPVNRVYEAAGAALSHLRKLAALDLVRLGQEQIWRDPLADRDFVTAEAPRLTADQARVWGRIKLAMIEAGDGDDEPAEDPGPGAESPTPAPFDETGEQKPFLLHGVTGSGKTEIYLRAVGHALEQGRQAIVLVPEIALTPQTVRRFAARFPGQVAVLHSRLSDGERYDTWRRARSGQFDIVVGPRSALFTPFENPGVIVLDEEHDHSYKQTPPVPPPYYNAREAAVELGRLTGATVILGSATPDLVSYHRARSGAYRLLELPKRIMGHRRRISTQAARLGRESSYQQGAGDPEDTLTIPLPPIQVVDLRQELRAGNRSIFSRALQEALDTTLARDEQAILFLNRRGTATFIMCRDCGLVLNCPRCAIPLTFHRPGMMLVCHTCGRKEPPPQECPRCGSQRIKYFGLGTEELQRRIEQRWPQARTVRWDRDTTAGKDTHEALLASFINREADILVGTQMIAKGLDLPLVTLVGVISADVSLGLPDYSVGEHTFQVLAQVAGRAGRGLLGGRVIIQSYQPEHYAIAAAAEHDYAGFYVEEIRFRTQHNLPPFRRLAKLVFVDPVDERAEAEARILARDLRRHARELQLSATEIVGPLPPFFNRLDGRYRWQIVVRSPDPLRLLRDFPIPAKWIVDIDPVSTL